MFLRRSLMLINCQTILRRNHTLINHQIYPLHDRQSNEYHQLISNARQQFHSTGCLYLPHFLTKQTLSSLLNEINSILTHSSDTLFQSNVQHTENLYETTSDKTNVSELQWSRKTLIAFDQIPSQSLLRQLYLWNSLTEFITDIIQIYPCLYRSCDELGALYVNIYRQSNQLGWHSDHSHFFVNLLLQQPSVCDEGVFEYKTKDHNDNDQIISRTDFQAGGLVLFNGRTYPHRVTAIQSSPIPRINAILTYDSTPNHHLSDYTRQKFFRSTTQNTKE